MPRWIQLCVLVLGLSVSYWLGANVSGLSDTKADEKGKNQSAHKGAMSEGLSIRLALSRQPSGEDDDIYLVYDVKNTDYVVPITIKHELANLHEHIVLDLVDSDGKIIKTFEYSGYAARVKTINRITGVEIPTGPPPRSTILRPQEVITGRARFDDCLVRFRKAIDKEGTYEIRGSFVYGGQKTCAPPFALILSPKK